MKKTPVDLILFSALLIFAFVLLLCVKYSMGDTSYVVVSESQSDSSLSIDNIYQGRIVKRVHRPTTVIVNEPLVMRMMRNLREKGCSHLKQQDRDNYGNNSYTFTDTCDNQTSFSYIFDGEESVHLERNYPDHRKLILIFSYEGKRFSVEGSRIVAPNGGVVKELDKSDIVKIIQSNFKI